MNLDWLTQPLNAPVTLFLFGLLFTVLNRHWNRANRSHKLMQIKIEALAHAVFMSANGHGEKIRIEYEKKIKELMAEEKFKN